MSNKLNELNSRQKFIDLNYNIFKLANKVGKENKYVYVEFNKWSCSHIAISNCIFALKKIFNFKVLAYPENGFQYVLKKKKILNKMKFFLGRSLGIKNFGIYKSFSTEDFLNLKSSNLLSKKADFISNKIEKKIKKKSDILKIKIYNILIGDLIYDSYLKEYNNETIDINDYKFKNFLKKSIEYFLIWYNEFKKKKIKAIISSQSVYLSSLPIRIGIYNKCICLVANPERLYRLTKKNIYTDKEFLFFKKIKKNIKKKYLKIGKKIADKRIKLRFRGKIGVDLSYLSKTAYGKPFKKKILTTNNKFKILIAPHSFSDAPHQLGNHLFPDYYEWLKFIIREGKNKNFDWYIKCHPNFVEYFDNTIAIIKKITKKYNYIKYLDPSTSHKQLINEGINAVITCHGTIGSEYPYFNIPVINASMSNPHVSYGFNFHPSNKKKLKFLINNIHLIKTKINKNELLEYYFFKNIYFSNNWLFKDIKDLINFSGGYKNIYKYKTYEYWIKNWNIKSQNKITNGIKNFIKSNNYMMTFNDYKISIEEHLNEYTF